MDDSVDDIICGQLFHVYPPAYNSEENTRIIVNKLYNVIRNGIDGDVVEMGCYRAGTSKFLMKTIEVAESDKNLFLYDSFQGLPELSQYDNRQLVYKGMFNDGVKPDDIIQLFDRLKLKHPVIIQKWFSELSENDLPNEISFSFIDGDLYQSIYDTLMLVYPKTTTGGCIFVHDYGKRKDQYRNKMIGVKKAVDKFIKDCNIKNDISARVYDYMLLIEKK